MTYTTELRFTSMHHQCRVCDKTIAPQLMRVYFVNDAVAAWACLPHREGDLVQCEACPTLYAPRPEGDMADLGQLCRTCAGACAMQLEHDYDLPWGAPDEERRAAMDPGSDGRRRWRCPNPRCARVWAKVPDFPWGCGLCGTRPSPCVYRPRPLERRAP